MSNSSHSIPPGINIDVNPQAESLGGGKKKSRGVGGGDDSKHRKERGQASYKFVDRARIRVRGGHGGSGSTSYKSLGKLKKRPDGGHGGHGGRVVVVADPAEQTLGMDRHHHAAEDGANGGNQARHGRNGRDKIVRVPCGVVVRRVLDYDEVWDEEHAAARKVTLEEMGMARGDGGLEIALKSPDNGTVQDGDIELSLGSNSHQNLDNSTAEDAIDVPLGSHNKNDDNIVSGDDEEDFEQTYFHTDSEGNSEPGKDSAEMTEEEVESVANTGEKARDGMYHWRAEEVPQSTNPFGLGDDEWVSSTEGIFRGVERQRVVLADLDKPGSYVVVSGGGKGGVGNSLYAKQHRQGQTRDVRALAGARSGGSHGETAHLELELKLIADLGLVGFPNAGKSSLLAAMSRASPEIAPYPFTTLHPLVGCIEYKDGFRVLAADVPGLIGGAADGRGRGHDFLRHLERTKALLYIVDTAGVDGRDPVEDLRVLADEIASYGEGDMLTRPALVVANKLDLIPDEEEREAILFDVSVVAEEAGIDYSGDVIGISAGVTGEGLEVLSKAIRGVVVKGEENRSVSEAEEFG